jgi:hypothetical protein
MIDLGPKIATKIWIAMDCYIQHWLDKTKWTLNPNKTDIET